MDTARATANDISSPRYFSKWFILAFRYDKYRIDMEIMKYANKILF